MSTPAIGVLVAAVVAVVWGLLLSPRRRVDAPLAVRVAVELVLITGAAAGLFLAGLHGWAVALIAGELITLVSLSLLGPPGAQP